MLLNSLYNATVIINLHLSAPYQEKQDLNWIFTQRKFLLFPEHVRKHTLDLLLRRIITVQSQQVTPTKNYIYLYVIIYFSARAW